MHTLSENSVADEIRTVIEKKLPNVPANLDAFIGTYSQGGKVIPRQRFHCERICEVHSRESRAVWAEIPARTGRGVNCPMEQGAVGR
jgi:sugar phosphate isomerase/epimerase